MRVKKVVVAGATGKLGSKIVKALLDQGANVTAMVRSTSNRTMLEKIGVRNYVIGDMMDRTSLNEALSPEYGFDAIVSSAAGYTRHSKGDNEKTDTIGYQNLVDAAKNARIPRFVLISILECDKAANVPHFYNKYLTEKYLTQKLQPFIALRPGAFFDFAEDRLIKKIKKGVIPVFFQGVDYGTIYTPDLARYAAMAAISLPEAELNTTIDVGWRTPVNSSSIVSAFTKVLGKQFRAKLIIPSFVIKVIAPIMAIFIGFIRDMLEMVKWVNTGVYVSKNTEKQLKLFGDLPTIEEAVGRFVKDNNLF
jgi:uncharacterized protein YbjT (DUF2867 family)